MRRCLFWLLVVVLTFAWIVNGIDFFVGVPQDEGHLWRDIDSFPWTYRVLRDLSDAAVAWPIVAASCLLLLYTANLWLLARIWRRSNTRWRAICGRTCVAAASIGAQVVYVAIVCEALSIAVGRMEC